MNCVNTKMCVLIMVIPVKTTWIKNITVTFNNIKPHAALHCVIHEKHGLYLSRHVNVQIHLCQFSCLVKHYIYQH